LCVGRRTIKIDSLLAEVDIVLRGRLSFVVTTIRKIVEDIMLPTIWKY